MPVGQLSNLRDRPDLFDQTIALIENSMGYDKHESFKIDFFPLMEKNNSEHDFILLENSKVLGHVGVKVREIGNFNLKMKVALIGGVAVLEEYRGKGILKRILKEVFTKFDHKVGLYILWSDLTSLYKKFDFHLAGAAVESAGSQNKNFYNRYTKTKLNNISTGDFNQIKSIYREFSLKDYLSFLRTDEDWESLKKIESVDLFILKDDNNKILGYFCQNKGMDLRGIVHEFGYLKENQNEIHKLFHSLKTWFPSVSSEDFPGKNIYQGFLRMGSLEIFNKFLWERSHGVFQILNWRETDVEIIFKNKKIILPKESFFPCIFGPYPPMELEKISCQLFFSGLDSI
jgi:predicted N-acetyltransferase YhbS